MCLFVCFPDSLVPSVWSLCLCPVRFSFSTSRDSSFLSVFLLSSAQCLSVLLSGSALCLFLVDPVSTSLHLLSSSCPVSRLSGSGSALCLTVSLSPFSSLAPHQVTAGTGSRSPTAPALGVCGSSCSTLRPWARGHSSSRPSLCTAAPSPRSCCRRSTSSRVGLPVGHSLGRGEQGCCIGRELIWEGSLQNGRRLREPHWGE